MVKMKGVGRGNNPNSRAQGRRNIRPGWTKPGPGRPKGSIEARKQLMLALKGEAPGLLKRLVKLAKAGDVAALRTLLAPLVAPAKDNVIHYEFVTQRETMDDLLVEMRNLEKMVATGVVTPGEYETLSKGLQRHRELMESAQAGDRRQEFDLDERLLDKIRRKPKLFQLAVRLLEFYQQALDDDDMARAHPITVLPQAIAERKPGGTKGET